jgi:hypothetical protein
MTEPSSPTTISQPTESEDAQSFADTALGCCGASLGDVAEDRPLPPSTFRRYLDPLTATVTEFHALNHALTANIVVLDVVVANALRAGVPLSTLAGILNAYDEEYVVRRHQMVATASISCMFVGPPSRRESDWVALHMTADLGGNHTDGVTSVRFG